jgi:lipoprotein-anchoring transpeptidase ErfK/SrfK
MSYRTEGNESSQFWARKSKIQATPRFRAAGPFATRCGTCLKTGHLDFALDDYYLRLAFPHMSLKFLRNLVLSAAPVLIFALTSCESGSSTQGYLGGAYGDNQTASAPQDSVSYWEGDNASGKPSIKIKLGEQRAYFYKGGQLVGVSQLSTGREGLTTPSGSFSITQKDKDHVSTKYGDYVDEGDNVIVPNVEMGKDPKPPGTHFKGAPMPYFMRIAGGVGMHAGYLPGYPASHGCIRMPEFMAENFFRSVSQGTPVMISH